MKFAIRRSLHSGRGRSLVGIALAASCATAFAQDEDSVELDEYTVEDSVNDSLNVLPTEPISSVFGFGKSVLETPRGVSTISGDFIDTYNIQGIDDIAVFVPGTFTSSFFGVAGALDIRGTPGETYFRGVRRLENNGNFPTPVGATDRIDIVRGPASPIAGPAKVGGFLNFVPRSARAETGQYLDSITGEIRLTGGSWDRRNVEAEVGGPIDFLALPAGFYIYAQNLNSDSYYQNSFNDQTLVQGSFNVDLTDNLRTEFGVMYQNWSGTENAGWNRVTQDLVDNGTYITGRARDIDTDNDGLISGFEAQAASPAALNPFCLPSIPGFCSGAIAAQGPNQALVPGTVGRTTLDGSQVNIAPQDEFDTVVTTGYFDLIYDLDNGITLTNKLFYDAQETFNTNFYGFSQEVDSWVIENQFIVSGDFEVGELQTAYQFSPSIRHTNAEQGDDFFYEYFDRVDLSSGVFDSRSNRRLSITTGAEPYSGFTQSEYTQYGLAMLLDNTFYDRFHLLGGVRYDWVDIETRELNDRVFFPLADPDADDWESGVSFTISGSVDLPYGFRPYVTYSEQRTLITGQGAELDVANVLNEQAFGVSSLIEGGVKGSFFDDRLFAALSLYEQERVDFSAQNLVTNNTTRTKGAEFEFRYLPPQVDGLTVFGAMTLIDVRNVNLDPDGDGIGSQFSFCGANDLPGIAPESFFGGAVLCVFNIGNNDSFRRGGIPDGLFSGGASWQITDKIRASFSVVHGRDVKAGFSGAIRLPDFTVANMALAYETKRWRVATFIDNVNDERYFRANFPDLFGNSTVLPELPINWSVQVAYKF